MKWYNAQDNYSLQEMYNSILNNLVVIIGATHTRRSTAPILLSISERCAHHEPTSRKCETVKRNKIR